MKQRIGFLFLFALIFCTLRGMAEENEYTLKYIYYDSGTASVIGYEGEPVNVIVPEEIEDENGKKYIVTSIGGYAFTCRTSLISIVLPEGLTTIEYGAFYECSSLSSIDFPKGLTSIGDGAFYGCSSLNSIELPGNLISLGRRAFSGCKINNISYLTNSPINASYDIFDSDIYSLDSVLQFSEESKQTFMERAPWCCFFDKEREEDIFFSYNGVYAEVIRYNHSKNIGDIVIPEMVIDEDGNSFMLNKIGEEAFYECRTLTSITLPEGLTSIGREAFAGCYSLTSVDLPEGLTSIGREAFAGCYSLTSVDLPEGLTDIGDGAFWNCTSFTSIDLPEGLTSIGRSMFSGCTSLTSIDLPEGLTSIGDGAFSWCTSLTSIDLPEGLTSMGYSAFRKCTSLTSITLPEGLTSIGPETFSGCTSLTSIGFPEGLTSIGDFAFPGCTSLSSIDLPEGLTSIGRGTFSGCYSLTSVDLPEGLTSIGGSTFSDCTSLTSVDLPEGLTSIGDGAFSGCTSLASIALPEGLTFIRNYAFSGCTSLASIALPEGLTSMGICAFENCTSLTSIALSEGLASISWGAFWGCPLEKITYLSQTPISAEDNIFDSKVYATTTLEIPKGSRETFIATTPWNLFKNIVEVGEEEPDPQPGEKYHLLTVNITNGFSAELSVKEGEKAAVALNLDEWWEPGEVKFNGSPLEVAASKIHTPEMTEPSTLEITPRYKGDVDILDFTTGVEKVEANGIEVEILDSSTVLVKGLQEGDEITVYTEAGHVIRSATATISTMTIRNLVSGNIYIIRINNHAVKVML